jgi:hypothetical protein
VQEIKYLICYYSFLADGYPEKYAGTYATKVANVAIMKDVTVKRMYYRIL